MTELADLGAAELIAAYRSRAASPAEAVRSCLERIERVDPSVNAVLTLCAGRALEAAEAAGRRWASGEARALEGVPVGVKDVIATAGVRTTGGSTIYGDHVPARSAAVVERLEAAGGIVLAKLQTMEFAMAESPHYGPTRNPWRLDRTTGGSSSGSAAALAAREMPLALGTDTGGSIRSPAAYCGVTGLKPTRGRVPRRGVMPLSWTLDHVGPMARSVEDAALLLTAIGGHDPGEAGSLRAGPESYAGDLDGRVAGLRIGVPVNWFFDVVDPGVARAARAAVEALRLAGAEVREVALPHAHLSEAMGWLITYAEFGSLHQATFERLDEYGQRLTRPYLVNAQFVTALDYLRALRLIPLLQHDFEEVFETVDAIVVPGMVSEAPALGSASIEVGGREWPRDDLVARTMFIFNLAGLPALAVPAGLGASGLPVGVQIAARPLGERTCIRVGHAFQRLTDHHAARPPGPVAPAGDGPGGGGR